MHRQPIPFVLGSTNQSSSAAVRLGAIAVSSFLALQSGSVSAQNLDADPLFGSISLESGFASAPFTVEVSPGGEDESFVLGDECYGYMRFAQPDFVLNYQSGETPLGVFAISDLDITMAINDPSGAWHCNDDSFFLSGTNSGIQFDSPQSGDYQIWVGSYDSGAESSITMLAITEVDEAEWASLSIGLEDSVYAASFDLNGDIVFGDDSSGFANDGECDDPRFQGSGMAYGPGTENLFRDASDCRAQYESGAISLAEPEDMNLSGDLNTDFFSGDSDIFSDDTASTSPIPLPDAGPFGEVFFALAQGFQAIAGDDAGALPLPFDLGGGGNAAAPDFDRDSMIALTGIDFGDNSSPFADDGECDDPRFEGPGAAGFTFDDGAMTDANDCSSLFLEGSITLIETDSAATSVVVDSSGINFGDNSSIFSDDGECDDPRFEGSGSAFSTSQENSMRDANDCRSLFESGQVTLVAGADPSPSVAAATTAIPQSQPVAQTRDNYEVGTPRGDINGARQEDGSLFASGTVYGDRLDPSDTSNNTLTPNVTNLAPAPARSTSTGGIQFGDNSSIYANDGECDDPRFEGDGMAAISFDEDIERDANDCRAAYEAGTITLIRN